MPHAHEVYPNAPLALVTAQVLFGFEPRLNDPDTRDQFAERIRGQLPVLSEENFAGLMIDFASGEGAQPLPSTKQIRATNEASTVSVVLANQAITVEATEYEHFDGFAAILRESLTALTETIGNPYVTRAGLRYIDEIRPKGVGETPGWSGWVSDALIAPVTLLPDGTAAGINGLVLFRVADQVNIVVRWGEMHGTTVIAPNAAVRRPTPPEGRFFVLDSDAFWQPEAPTMVDADTLLDTFEELHRPISEVFEASLTPNARALFRGETVDA